MVTLVASLCRQTVSNWRREVLAASHTSELAWFTVKQLRYYETSK
jgi:hypothetical protein